MTTLTDVKYYLFIFLLVLMSVPVYGAGYVGPTPNITKVANAISINHKSLTTAVIVGAGLNLTQPVEISIGFYSPWGNDRITQFYALGPGNNFLHHDNQGDGLARQLRVAISFSEKNPAGVFYTYAMLSTVTLDPLYRVSIGPLSFTVIDDCDLVGDNEIYLSWLSPDLQYHKKSFSTPTSRPNLIREFSWFAAEVSPSSKLNMPALKFEEIDSGFVNFVTSVSDCVVKLGCTFSAALAPQLYGGLVPGQSQIVKGNLKEKSKQCPAYYEYQYQTSVNYYDAVTMAKLMANHSLAR